MDNLGDWLYVIVAIIAGISGIVSSARKKKRPAEVFELPLPQEEDWLPRPEPEQAPPPPKKPKAKVKKPELYKVPAVVQQDYFPPEVQIDNPFGISLEELQDGDGVKKAIIYSEILNRKY
ncbi:hypothetical protein FACS189438_1240 [Bacteroidia bacterium]|nr:hypothetical protein FACS189438_1240 [Bacteroidia bacterium]